MTREEAAKILYQENSNAGWMRWVGFPVDIKKEQDYKRFILAVDVALDALRTPETNWPCWIRTADCRPCAEDASHTGMVLAYKASLNAVTVVKWGYCTPKAYPYWMPYPASPHNENREG